MSGLSDERRMKRGIGSFMKKSAVGMGAMVVALVMSGRVEAQEGYQKPPAAMEKVLNAPVTPRANVGRARDIVLFYTPVVYPPIAQVAEPFAKLAGWRIDIATSGPHNAPQFYDLHLKRVADGTETKVETASGYTVSQPVPAA